MEMVDRYIYAVTQRLPERQRMDIRQELQSLIEDMLEERAPAGQASREDVESVLLELGDPNALAVKYRGYDRYLISPMMFESYLTTLKIVLISIAVAMPVLFAIERLFSPAEILEQFTDFVVTLISAGMQGFVWVTVIFALIDYRQRKDGIDHVDKKGWKPSDLPQIPDRTTHIKMSEPIASIIFIVLFTVICLYSIDLLGIWRFNDGERVVIPFLNAEVFQNYLPIIWIVAALGILKESIRIIVRKRTGNMLALHTVITVASTILVCIVLSDSAIWNPDFIQQLVVSGILPVGGEDYDTINSIWTRSTELVIDIIILIAIIDILSETYKWYRAKASHNSR